MKKKSFILVVFIVILIVMVACNSNSSTPSGETTPNGISLTPVRGSLNTKKPYDAYHYGLFDDQTYTYSTTYRDGNAEYPVSTTTVTYSAFIPSDFQVKSSVYVILIPDNTTAKDFARSEIGTEWIELAATDEDPFAVVFVEPQDGGTWNTTEASSGRDEASVAFAVFTSIRDKTAATNAFISVDKSGVRLVGYEEGADAAALWAAAWPQLFANTTLINPTKYDSSRLEKWFDSYIFPYAIDSSSGYDEHMTSSSVAMPIFLYGESSIINRFKSKYDSINNSFSTKDPSFDRTLLNAKVLSDSSAETIYDNASQNNRFLGYPGGTIRGVYGAYSDSRFKPVWESTIDGYVRRWMVYVPSTYNRNEPVPLVVALHGSSASITDLPEESRWADVADEEGFIVLFVQGYPVGDPNPIPSWFSLSGGAETDIEYIKTVVGRVQDEYHIDASKMYLTGHSMGSMMTQAFAASDSGDFFAAYGPVGYTCGGSMLSSLGVTVDADSNETVLPMWFFKGEYDLTGYSLDKDDSSADGDAFQFWADMNNIKDSYSSESNESLSGVNGDKYTTYSYSSDSVPVVKYTQVHESPHTYMPEESILLWSWFKNWSRGEDGSALYNGTTISIR